MRKSCPYCGVQLWITEEKSRSPWLMARCSQCASLGVVKLSPQPYTVRPKKVINMAKVHELRETMANIAAAHSDKPVQNRIEFSGALSASEEEAARDLPFQETLLQRFADFVIRFSRGFSIRTLAAPLILFVVSFEIFYGGIRRYTASAKTEKPAVVFREFEETPIAVSQASATSPRDSSPPSATLDSKEGMIAQVATASAVLRAGPGTGFRKVGNASAETKWKIKSSRDGWLQVEPIRISFVKSGIESDSWTAWIRQDLVRVVQAESIKEVTQ